MRSYQVKVLTPKEWERVTKSDARYQNTDDSWGFSDPIKRVGFVRSTKWPELNQQLLAHEFEHLIETQATDEDEFGIRHKKGFKQIIHPILKIASVALAPLTGGASLLYGPLADTGIAAQQGQRGVGRTFVKSYGQNVLGAGGGAAVGGALGASAGLGTVGQGAASGAGAGVGSALATTNNPGEILRAGLRGGATGGALASLGTMVRPGGAPGGQASTTVGAQSQAMAAPRAPTAFTGAPTSGGSNAIGASRAPLIGTIRPASSLPHGLQGLGTTPPTWGSSPALPPTSGASAFQAGSAGAGGGRPPVPPSGPVRPAGYNPAPTPPGTGQVQTSYGVNIPQQAVSGAQQPGILGQLGIGKSVAAGAGVSLLGDMLAPKPQIPDLGGLESISNLRNSAGQPLSDVGRLATTRLSEQLSAPYGGLQSGVEQSIRNTFERERERVISQFKAIRPNADLTSDSAFRQAMQEVDAREADSVAQANQQEHTRFQGQRTQDIATALGIDTQTLNTLVELAQLDVAAIVAQTQLDAQAAQQFKDTFSNIGTLIATQGGQTLVGMGGTP